MTIDALIVKGNQILLIKRGADTYKGYWALPGGYVELDEDVPTALRREVREELNVEATITGLLGIYSQPGRSPRQAISAVFKADITGNPTPGDDAVACEWYRLDNLPKELAFDHAKIIEDYKKDSSKVHF